MVIVAHCLLQAALLFVPSPRAEGVPRVVAALADRQRRAFLDSGDWTEIYRAVIAWEKWPTAWRGSLAKSMLPLLRSGQRSPITRQGNLILFRRIKSGELDSIGYGRFVGQDLFISGGRAAWAISELIGDDTLPVIEEGLEAGEWNKRALAIEAKVKAFVEKAEKPKK